MKDQRSPSSAEIVAETLHMHEEQLPVKKLQDTAAGSVTESDGDSGILNLSDVSLDSCGAMDDGDNNNVTADEEDAEVPSWRLKKPPRPRDLSDEALLDSLILVEEQLKAMPACERKKWAIDVMRETFADSMPEFLLEIGAANLFDGDTGISMDVRPDWLDIEKYKRGQKFAREHKFGISYAELLSLFTMFSFEHGLKPLIATGQSSTPYTAFKRYLSTSQRVTNWYTYDPWTPGTPAYNDVRTVRQMHALVRKNLADMSTDEFVEKTTIKEPWCPTLSVARRDFESTCPAPKAGQCPYFALSRRPDQRGKDLSQGQMSLTQFAFTGLLVLQPKMFGCHDATNEDLEAFCHLWRGIGYLLGIDDEYNFCRGTLADVQQRSREFLEYWVKPNFRTIHPEWEHMMRCVIEGLKYYFPGSTFETCLLDFAEIMNLHMPRFVESMPYSTWIKRGAIKFYFKYACRLAGMRALMNHQLEMAQDKAKKYDEEKHKELQKRSEKTLSSYQAEIAKPTAPSPPAELAGDCVQSI